MFSSSKYCQDAMTKKYQKTSLESRCIISSTSSELRLLFFSLQLKQKDTSVLVTFLEFDFYLNKK